MPTIALARCEPRERTEGRGDGRTHHGRMKADCERVRADRREGGDLGRDAARPKEERRAGKDYATAGGTYADPTRGGAIPMASRETFAKAAKVG